MGREMHSQQGARVFRLFDDAIKDTRTEMRAGNWLPLVDQLHGRWEFAWFAHHPICKLQQSTIPRFSLPRLRIKNKAPAGWTSHSRGIRYSSIRAVAPPPTKHKAHPRSLHLQRGIAAAQQVTITWQTCISPFPIPKIDSTRTHLLIYVACIKVCCLWVGLTPYLAQTRISISALSRVVLRHMRGGSTNRRISK